MTQIKLRNVGTGPGTHALVIGVGWYEHLIDGPNEKDEAHLGLKVLESPPHSAMALAEWVVGRPGQSGLNNPAAPVATLEILISAKVQLHIQDLAGTTHAIEPARTTEVQAGFDRWLAQVQSHKDNVGILYFCGHGVITTEVPQYLLLADHGHHTNNIFKTGSFDITNTVRALLREVPCQLYVFVDACQNFQAQLSSQMGSKPHPLLGASARTTVVNTGMTHIEAAGEGTHAYGDAAGVSRFTTALLKTLDGYCGKPTSLGEWHVTGRALSVAIPELLDMVNRLSATPQSCAAKPSGLQDRPIHISNTPPRVIVEISVNPAQKRTLGTFRMEDLARPSAAPITGGGTQDVWRTEAERGMYMIRVLPKGAAFTQQDHDRQYVDPPVFHLPIDVGN